MQLEYLIKNIENKTKVKDQTILDIISKLSDIRDSDHEKQFDGSVTMKVQKPASSPFLLIP